MKKTGLLLTFALLLGCDGEATYRAQEQRRQWAEEDEQKRIVKKCGEKPSYDKLSRRDWEVTLRIVGSDVTFPFVQYYDTWAVKVTPIPEFIYQTIARSGGEPVTYFSEKRPEQARDGLYELFDLKSGEKKLLAPNVTISLARVEEASIDDTSADLRRQAQEFIRLTEAWKKCAGHSETPTDFR